ncbi:hypothetical protein LPJ66_003538 [Kickxella alabastrina]|uniref:Uncharacterized protein n=1 Tax=Kickxella alabastrina TaxID=61397 RepID=A0ACC1IP16_9FUNG|nr:hypothetical protein LPJ66_003538 [Kickxella alabastrina]
MFGPFNTAGASAQNKENAGLGSIARPNKSLGLPHKPTQTTTHPSKTPSRQTILTPSNKKILGATTKSKAPGLRIAQQTPLNPRPKPMAQVYDQQIPKTVRRLQGLFTPRIQQQHHMRGNFGLMESEILMLEPEYVPMRPRTPPWFDALSEVGLDLDVGMVPRTQGSTAGVKLNELPELDLKCELLVDISVTPPLSPVKSGKSMIPRPRFTTSPGILCRPQVLVANSLNPTRIPQLKRKR